MVSDNREHYSIERNIMKATHPVESSFNIRFFGFFGKISTKKYRKIFYLDPQQLVLWYTQSYQVTYNVRGCPGPANIRLDEDVLKMS